MSKDTETVELLISNLRKSTKFGYVKAVVEGDGGIPNRSWDLFRRDVLAGVIGLPLAKLNPLLGGLYSDQLVGGERYIRVHQPAKADREALWNLVSKAKPAKTTASQRFPYFLSDSELADIPSRPTFTGRSELDDGSIALTFLSGRYIDERIKYKQDEVSEAVQKAFAGFDEFIVVRKIFKQCADAVVISPNAKRVELRLDVPSTNNIEFGEICAQQLTNEFHALVHGPGGAPLLGHRVNFFPAIHSLYSDAKAGRVVELGFETPTNSVKTERMRDRDSDLRKELFHKGGKVAVPNITPFKISVKFGDSTKKFGEILPVLSLPGNFRELSKPKGELYLAVVDGCLTEDLFRQTIDTLLNHC